MSAVLTAFDPQTVRLDDYALTYLAPTGEPLVYAREASVFRGMNDKQAACEYARTVAAFFASQGCAATVFVVQGPTTTTRCEFEVVTSPCGYSIVSRKEATL